MEKVKNLNVPKIPQIKNHCLPCSVSMVLGYYGLETNQIDVARNLIGNLKEGYDTNGGMFKYLRSKELIVRSYWNSSIDRLVYLIRKDIPPIVRIKPSIPHFCVVTGFDLDRRTLFVNDPYYFQTSERSFEDFSKIWHVDEPEDFSHNYLVSIRKK